MGLLCLSSGERKFHPFVVSKEAQLRELGCISPEQKLRNTHTRKRTHEQHVLIENEVSFARHPTDVIDAASEHCVHCKYPDTDARLKNSKLGTTARAHNANFTRQD